MNPLTQQLSKQGSDASETTEQVRMFHGSPNPSLTSLNPGSYVTPDQEIAELMGRYHQDTGKTWDDSDLQQPHKLGEPPTWAEGREPAGIAHVYELLAKLTDLDLLDNPYEHQTKEVTSVQKTANPPLNQQLPSESSNPLDQRLPVEKIAGELESFINRSELMGSRGRARKYGRPEPEDRDYDRVVFTDDTEEQQNLMSMLRRVAELQQYKQHERPGGFLTVSGDDMDLSVYPTSKRNDIHKAWELIEGGLSKDDAWGQLNSEQNKIAGEGWYIGQSDIEGQGVFAGKDYEPGDVIDRAMVNGGKDEFDSQIWNLTLLARRCNHQDNNNVVIKKNGDGFDLAAAKPISQDDELVADYRQVTRAAGPHSCMMWNGENIPESDLEDFTEKE